MRTQSSPKHLFFWTCHTIHSSRTNNSLLLGLMKIIRVVITLIYFYTHPMLETYLKHFSFYTTVLTPLRQYPIVTRHSNNVYQHYCCLGLVPLVFGVYVGNQMRRLVLFSRMVRWVARKWGQNNVSSASTKLKALFSSAETSPNPYFHQSPYIYHNDSKFLLVPTVTPQPDYGLTILVGVTSYLIQCGFVVKIYLEIMRALVIMFKGNQNSAGSVSTGTIGTNQLPFLPVSFILTLLNVILLPIFLLTYTNQTNQLFGLLEQWKFNANNNKTNKQNNFIAPLTPQLINLLIIGLLQFRVGNALAILGIWIAIMGLIEVKRLCWDKREIGSTFRQAVGESRGMEVKNKNTEGVMSKQNNQKQLQKDDKKNLIEPQKEGIKRFSLSVKKVTQHYQLYQSQWPPYLLTVSLYITVILASLLDNGTVDEIAFNYQLTEYFCYALNSLVLFVEVYSKLIKLKEDNSKWVERKIRVPICSQLPKPNGIEHNKQSNSNSDKSSSEIQQKSLLLSVTELQVSSQIWLSHRSKCQYIDCSCRLWWLNDNKAHPIDSKSGQTQNIISSRQYQTELQSEDATPNTNTITVSLTANRKLSQMLTELKLNEIVTLASHFNHSNDDSGNKYQDKQNNGNKNSKLMPHVTLINNSRLSTLYSELCLSQYGLTLRGLYQAVSGASTILCQDGSDSNDNQNGKTSLLSQYNSYSVLLQYEWASKMGIGSTGNDANNQYSSNRSGKTQNINAPNIILYYLECLQFVSGLYATTFSLLSFYWALFEDYQEISSYRKDDRIKRGLGMEPNECQNRLVSQRRLLSRSNPNNLATPLNKRPNINKAAIITDNSLMSPKSDRSDQLSSVAMLRSQMDGSIVDRRQSNQNSVNITPIKSMNQSLRDSMNSFDTKTEVSNNNNQTKSITPQVIMLNKFQQLFCMLPTAMPISQYIPIIPPSFQQLPAMVGLIQQQYAYLSDIYEQGSWSQAYLKWRHALTQHTFMVSPQQLKKQAQPKARNRRGAVYGSLQRDKSENSLPKDTNSNQLPLDCMGHYMIIDLNSNTIQNHSPRLGNVLFGRGLKWTQDIWQHMDACEEERIVEVTCIDKQVDTARSNMSWGEAAYLPNSQTNSFLGIPNSSRNANTPRLDSNIKSQHHSILPPIYNPNLQQLDYRRLLLPNAFIEAHEEWVKGDFKWNNRDSCQIMRLCVREGILNNTVRGDNKVVGRQQQYQQQLPYQLIQYCPMQHHLIPYYICRETGQSSISILTTIHNVGSNNTNHSNHINHRNSNKKNNISHFCNSNSQNEQNLSILPTIQQQSFDPIAIIVTGQSMDIVACDPILFRISSGHNLLFRRVEEMRENGGKVHINSHRGINQINNIHHNHINHLPSLLQIFPKIQSLTNLINDRQIQLPLSQMHLQKLMGMQSGEIDGGRKRRLRKIDEGAYGNKINRGLEGRDDIYKGNGQSESNGSVLNKELKYYSIRVQQLTVNQFMRKNNTQQNQSNVKTNNNPLESNHSKLYLVLLTPQTPLLTLQTTKVDSIKQFQQVEQSIESKKRNNDDRNGRNNSNSNNNIGDINSNNHNYYNDQNSSNKSNDDRQSQINFSQSSYGGGQDESERDGEEQQSDDEEEELEQQKNRQIIEFIVANSLRGQSNLSNNNNISHHNPNQKTDSIATNKNTTQNSNPNHNKPPRSKKYLPYLIVISFAIPLILIILLCYKTNITLNYYIQAVKLTSVTLKLERELMEDTVRRIEGHNLGVPQKQRISINNSIKTQPTQKQQISKILQSQHPFSHNKYQSLKEMFISEKIFSQSIHSSYISQNNNKYSSYMIDPITVLSYGTSKMVYQMALYYYQSNRIANQRQLIANISGNLQIDQIDWYLQLIPIHNPYYDLQGLSPSLSWNSPNKSDGLTFTINISYLSTIVLSIAFLIVYMAISIWHNCCNSKPNQTHSPNSINLWQIACQTIKQSKIQGLLIRGRVRGNGSKDTKQGSHNDQQQRIFNYLYENCVNIVAYLGGNAQKYTKSSHNKNSSSSRNKQCEQSAYNINNSPTVSLNNFDQSTPFLPILQQHCSICSQTLKTVLQSESKLCSLLFMYPLVLLLIIVLYSLLTYSLVMDAYKVSKYHQWVHQEYNMIVYGEMIGMWESRVNGDTGANGNTGVNGDTISWGYLYGDVDRLMRQLINSRLGKQNDKVRLEITKASETILNNTNYHNHQYIPPTIILKHASIMSLLSNPNLFSFNSQNILLYNTIYSKSHNSLLNSLQLYRGLSNTHNMAQYMNKIKDQDKFSEMKDRIGIVLDGISRISIIDVSNSSNITNQKQFSYGLGILLTAIQQYLITNYDYSFQQQQQQQKNNTVHSRNTTHFSQLQQSQLSLMYVLYNTLFLPHLSLNTQNLINFISTIHLKYLFIITLISYIVLIGGVWKLVVMANRDRGKNYVVAEILGLSRDK